MKHTKVVLSLLLISSAGMVLAHSSATPYFNIRSQSANLALEMVGQEGYINRYESDGNYTVFSLTPAYQQSFDKSALACCLFGQDLVKCGDCSQLTISGSEFPNRGDKDWLADYFGLPTDFKSTIQFNPRIRNVLVDANFFFGLDEWWHPGMYFRMHIPFVHTRWELDYCETVSSKGVNDYPFGYFTGNLSPIFASASASWTDAVDFGNKRSEQLCNVSSFVSDCKTADLTNIIISQVPEDGILADLESLPLYPKEFLIFEPLNFARWAGCDCSPLTKNGVADWRFTLGYNAYMSDKFHVGFGVTGAAPTGNRPHGQFLFEPIIGNGNHWELGGQFTSHYRFWQSEDEEKSLTGYLDANLTHMFKTRQTRSFDLKGKPNSRYMLALKLEDATYGQVAAEGIALITETRFVNSGIFTLQEEFANHYAPVANLTTVDVDVNIGAQIDLALMLNYTTRNYSFDLGYNLWARTCERIKLRCDCPTRLDTENWALKGTSHTYAISSASAPGGGFANTRQSFHYVDCAGKDMCYFQQIPRNVVPIPVSESNATIHGSGKITACTSTVPGPLQPAIPQSDFTNLNVVNNHVDSPQFGLKQTNFSVTLREEFQTVDFKTTENLTALPIGDVFGVLPSNFFESPILLSTPAVTLTNNDLDLNGAATKGLSHKVFAHFSYQWLDDERDYVPFLGLGGSAEFANNDGDCCPKSCPTTTSSSSSCGSSSSTCCKTDCKTDCKEKCKLDCKRCALSQWSVWLKGGFSFD